MEVTRVIAVRHGETAWNVDTRIQGHLDIPLNRNGRWQAERLAEAVQHEGLSAVYASDLGRAFETAQAIAGSLGLEVCAEPALRERGFGVFEGMTFVQVEARWPEQAERWRKRDPAFGPEGGETLRGFYERCVSAAEALAQRHLGEAIAVVAHGGVMDCLYRAASRVELDAPRTWLLGNASINRLLYTGEGFTLVGWGDTQHLDAASLDEVTERA